MPAVAPMRRASGKSNTELVCSFVATAAPETVFTYADLARVLETDTDTRYKRPAICGAVRRANRRLLRDHQRELRNVPGTGFRLVPASEHIELARQRRGKADRQLARGLLTLRHVKWDEMDGNQRRAHEGTLMIMESVASAIALISRRQDRHAALIADLQRRVTEVEDTHATQ